MDLYRRRSWIENELHRELKQAWHIERFPKKTDQACRAHIFLTLLLYNLAHVFQTVHGKTLVERGIRRLRAERLRSIHHLIVIAHPYFAIVDVEHFAALSGNPPKHPWRLQPLWA